MTEANLRAGDVGRLEADFELSSQRTWHLTPSTSREGKASLKGEALGALLQQAQLWRGEESALWLQRGPGG